MNELLQWGLGIVQWIQLWRNPILDQFFLSINFLGDEDFYLLFLPVIVWCVSKQWGIRLGALFLFSMVANQFLKDLLAAPRPYQLDPKLHAPIKQGGYGIPSMHAQSTTTVWGFMALQIRQPLWWAIAVAIPLSVGLGRMYLADHFPQDVLLGLALGVLSLVAYGAFEPAVSAWVARQTPTTQLGLVLVITVAFALVHLTEDTGKLIGTFLGFFAGLIGERQWVRFEPRTTWRNQLLKLAIGLTVTFALRFGIKALLPATALAGLLRYAVIGLWVGLGAPALFVAAHLAERRTGDSG